MVYFHCDHFEPWRWPIDQNLDLNVAEVLRFADVSAANEFSRRLTLFYKVHNAHTLNTRAKGAVLAFEGDAFAFLPRSPRVEEACRTAMTGLAERVDHEFQVHIHHENYTSNTSHRDPRALATFERQDSRERDAARFEFALRLGLSAMRRETGLALDHWFFVHGQWALNASDPGICNITNEIEILLRNGARGDFTFPAGRQAVDPHLEVPHFVRPVDAPAGYRLPQADPELAFGNADAAKTKFFIWASQIRHRGTSLDYYTDHVLQDISNPVDFAARILNQAYVAEGTLYFKTHAHSMHPNYWAGGEAPVFPHQHPDVRRMMATLFDAANAAGAEIEFLTASEVYDEFIRPRPAPWEGFTLSVSARPRGTVDPTPAPANVEPDVAWASEINALASRLILDSRTAQTAADRGVGSYYYSRAQVGEVLAVYERRVALALLGEPTFDAVYEIGSGVSALTICMALNGVRAIGIERDAGRARLGLNILAHMAAAHPDLAARCEIHHSSAPLAIRGIDGRNGAIVFTNVTGTMAPNEIDELIELAAGFRVIVVDLARFFEPRDPLAQAALLDRFCRAGWGVPSPVADEQATYRIFRKG